MILNLGMLLTVHLRRLCPPDCRLKPEDKIDRTVLFCRKWLSKMVTRVRTGKREVLVWR